MLLFTPNVDWQIRVGEYRDSCSESIVCADSTLSGRSLCSWTQANRKLPEACLKQQGQKSYSLTPDPQGYFYSNERHLQACGLTNPPPQYPVLVSWLVFKAQYQAYTNPSSLLWLAQFDLWTHTQQLMHIWFDIPFSQLFLPVSVSEVFFWAVSEEKSFKLRHFAFLRKTVVCNLRNRRFIKASKLSKCSLKNSENEGCR